MLIWVIQAWFPSVKAWSDKFSSICLRNTKAIFLSLCGRCHLPWTVSSLQNILFLQMMSLRIMFYSRSTFLKHFCLMWLPSLLDSLIHQYSMFSIWFWQSMLLHSAVVWLSGLWQYILTIHSPNMSQYLYDIHARSMLHVIVPFQWNPILVQYHL